MNDFFLEYCIKQALIELFNLKFPFGNSLIKIICLVTYLVSKAGEFRACCLRKLALGMLRLERIIGILHVFKTRRGVLGFYRFLQLEEEYWSSTRF